MTDVAAVNAPFAAANQAAILDALPARIALLDADGVIVWVNEAWRRFASADGLQPPPDLGSNYLSVCADTVGPFAANVPPVSDGIRAVLDGREPSFSIEYACHSPEEKRWFTLSVMPVDTGPTRGAVVMHADITTRKTAAYEMEQALERLSEAQHVGRIGDWDFCIETGLITWSACVYDILGRDPALGPPLTSEENAALFAPESRTILAENIDRAIASGVPQEYELVVSRQSGPPVHVHAFAVPVKDETGVVRRIHGTVQDISARKHAQSELQDRERELRETQRLARLGNWYQDARTGALRWSEEVATIFGFVPPVYDLTLDELSLRFSPESFARLRAAIARVREFGEPYEMEVEIIRADGSQGWMLSRGEPVRDATGTVIAARGTVLDITERKQAEADAEKLSFRTALRERTLSTLLSSITDFAYIYDLNGRFLFANQPLLDLWGIQLEAAVGKDFAQLGYPDELAKKLQREIAQVIETRESITGETPYTNPAGSSGSYEYIFSPVIGEDGNVEFVVGSTRDITARKRTEDELRASDDKFQQIAANVTDVFWIRSPDMSELYFLSPGFERIWGRPLEDLRSRPKSWTEFVVEEDRERVSAAFAGLEGDAPTVDIDYRIMRPDGETRWVRARGFQVRDERGTHVRNTGVATDITERQVAAAALAASAEQYRRLAEVLQKSEADQRRQADQLEIERSRLVAAQQVAKVGSWETDLASLDVRWSEEMYRIFGRDPQATSFAHTTFLEMVHPDDRARVSDAFARSMDEPGTSSIEHRVVMPDGTVKTVEERWQVAFDAQGKPVRAIGTCQDTTERRRAEDALRRSQKRLRDVFDGLGPSMFVALLRPDGVLVEINRSALTAAGVLARDVIGKPFDETRWWTYSPEVQRQLRESMVRARGGESSRYDVRTRGAGHDVIDIDFSLEPLRDESGKVIYLIASASVITDRKIAEDALRQAQKMEAVGQLAAGVAHEFNNLLQALMATSAIIRYQATTAAIAKAGTDLEALVKRGGGLTEQLLLFARDSTIEKSAVDLARETRVATAFLRPLMPETIAIVLDVPSEPLMVEADAGQIQQVLLNLALNARDAMPAGGTLTLRAGRIGGEVFQEVEDSGHGMSAETRAHLFEPFFSTKKPAKGTGLGLAVAHGIIEQYGGRFEVHTTVGEGSRFRFILPASSSEEAVLPRPATASSPVSGSGRVFLVEDDPSVRAGVATLLELMGYTVVTARSGEEAIALAVDPAPQVLLSDVTLPGIPGPRVAALLRERWPSLKIVLMSGYFEETMQSDAIRDGWHFLKKPFELDTLAQVMAIAMDTHLPVTEGSPHRPLLH